MTLMSRNGRCGVAAAEDGGAVVVVVVALADIAGLARSPSLALLLLLLALRLVVLGAAVATALVDAVVDDGALIAASSWARDLEEAPDASGVVLCSTKDRMITKARTMDASAS